MPLVCSASGLLGQRRAAYYYYDAAHLWLICSIMAETAALDECSNQALTARTACILSYNGSASHMILNNNLLAVTLAGCAWMQWQQQQVMMNRSALDRQLPEESRMTTSSRSFTAVSNDNNTNDNIAAFSMIPDRRRQPPTTRAAFLSLAFAVTFQVGLCLLLQCSGISIVWCAGAGWMLYGSRQHPAPSLDRHRNLLRFWGPLALDGAGIIFYAITSELLTTIAHICATVMGATLYWITSST